MSQNTYLFHQCSSVPCWFCTSTSAVTFSGKAGKPPHQNMNRSATTRRVGKITLRTYNDVFSLIQCFLLWNINSQASRTKGHWSNPCNVNLDSSTVISWGPGHSKCYPSRGVFLQEVKVLCWFYHLLWLNYANMHLAKAYALAADLLVYHAIPVSNGERPRLLLRTETGMVKYGCPVFGVCN